MEYMNFRNILNAIHNANLKDKNFSDFMEIIRISNAIISSDDIVFMFTKTPRIYSDDPEEDVLIHQFIDEVISGEAYFTFIGDGEYTHKYNGSILKFVGLSSNILAGGFYDAGQWTWGVAPNSFFFGVNVRGDRYLSELDLEYSRNVNDYKKVRRNRTLFWIPGYKGETKKVVDKTKIGKAKVEADAFDVYGEKISIDSTVFSKKYFSKVFQVTGIQNRGTEGMFVWLSGADHKGNFVKFRCKSDEVMIIDNDLIERVIIDKLST